MTVEYEYTTVIVMVVSALIILIASMAIPVYGYKRKRFKGLALGCLLQPVVCVLVVLASIFAVYLYYYWDMKRQEKAAMVTIRSLESHDNRVDTLMWYIKDNDECLLDIGQEDYEDKKTEKNSEEIVEDVSRKKYQVTFFDVIRLNATSVGVEDRVVVKFDYKAKKVTATDFGAPAEVVNVDWEKVKAYLEKEK